MNDHQSKLSTLCIHGGRRSSQGDSAVVTPIYQTSTFVPDPEDYAKVEAGETADSRFYSRYGNPTVAAVEHRIAALEAADEARLFSSGNAAMHASLMALALPGGHVVAADKLYGGTRAILDHCLTDAGGSVTYVDLDDHEALRAAVTPATRVLVCESIANPTLEVSDIPYLETLAREQGLALVVDATYATPIHQRPITLGADLVVHSASKYYGGHSDLVAGAVAGSREIVSRITTWRMNGGGCCDPHVAFLIDRGIKTLALRMGAHNRGGQALAEFLEGHSRVRRVNYPGLPSFAHHDRARELLKGMGGMVLFSLDGEDDEADILLSRLRLALPAPSLGGVESLVCQPARTSHAKMSEQERLAVGILPGTIRVSVGIEDPGDLIADFEQALAGSVIE